MNLTATAEDNQGVASVRFTVDDAMVGSEDAEPPYSIQWNTLDHADGEHTLKAVARDAAGNVASSTPTLVTVSNAPAPPGSIRVTTATTGTHLDPDGYTLLVAGRQVLLTISDDVTLPDVPPGTYAATLTGVAPNCTTHGTTLLVSVLSGATVGLDWALACSQPVGQIAFNLYDYQAYNLWLINSDGSAMREILQTGTAEISPAWSPDGMKLAFTRVLSSYQIVVRNLVGGAEVQLTNGAAHSATPAWSPDGSKIAFERGEGGDSDIYVMAANGTGPINLTNNPSSDLEPAWSPDGTRIAFRSLRDGNWEIYVMDSDGSNVTRLTETPESESGPAWSPDGSRIAFASSRDGNQELYLMDPDGSNVLRLTNDPATDKDPTWEGSGERIAFVRQGSQDDIWIMDANGGNQIAITNSTYSEGEPAWRPY